jgi:CysZ protein
VQGAIAVTGLLVPGGQVLAPPAMLLFTLLFLPLDYASYALDRRRLRFRDKRRWILDHRGVMLGFGAAAFVLCLVPVLNLLAMPVLVTAGTLLVLRNPPRSPSRSPSSRSPGGGAGTATST